MTRILAARLDHVGDVLLMGPAIRALQGAGPVTVLASPSGAGAARLLPGVDDVVEWDAPWISADPPAVRRSAVDALVGALADRSFDEAVIFTSFHQSPLPLALLARLAGIERIGAICDDYPGSLLDVRHHVPDDVHEVERALSLAAALGHHLPEDDDGRLHVHLEDPSPLGLRREPPVPYVVVHPGASVAARTWDPSRFERLVAALCAEGRTVAVTGGPSERALTAQVAGGHPSAFDLAGHLDLAGLARLIAGAEAIVVGNTGPAHLAAAVGTPVVSLFPPTVPAARWRPWRVPHVLLGEQSIPCAGCRARTCPVPSQPCLATITVEAVLGALDQLADVRSVAV